MHFGWAWCLPPLPSFEVVCQFFFGDFVRVEVEFLLDYFCSFPSCWWLVWLALLVFAPAPGFGGQVCCCKFRVFCDVDMFLCLRVSEGRRA